MKLSILAHAAWQPTAETPKPDVSWIPALQRRRLSPLDRTACALAHECLNAAGFTTEEPAMVLASRYGEIGILAGILTSIHDRAPVSPTVFSGSVHHTALGHLSILRHDHAPSCAVAAGPATFAAGWWETFCLAEAKPQTPVLLIAAEDEFPRDFLELAPAPGFGPGGCAFLLVPDTGHHPSVTLAPDGPGATAATPEALLSWLAAPASELRLSLPTGALLCQSTRP